MKIKDYVFYLKAFIKARCFGIKTPLLIGWDLTYRCNCDCKYCGISSENGVELSTAETLSLLSELANLGLKRIHFGGGEPLLREDIDKILGFCKQKHIFIAVLTNGILFKERLPAIKNADLIKISLDGPESVHDGLRKIGSFKNAINAIALAKENRLNVAINTTLSAYNLDCIDFILKVAKDFKVPVKFQPVNNLLAGDKDIKSFFCSDLEYSRAIRKIIDIKRRKGGNIINSIAGLQYLLNYPRSSGIKCCAGLLYFRITPEGKIYPCSARIEEVYETRGGCSNLKEAISMIYPKTCGRCLCSSTLELNAVYSLKIRAIKDLMRSA